MAGGKGKRIEMTKFWRTKDIPSCVLSHLLDHEDDWDGVSLTPATEHEQKEPGKIY